MRIARDLAGFSYGQADVLRKAVGKKIKKLLDEQEEKIVSGMVDNGIDKKTANKIWEFIVPFARYGFNRSHAACYAMIAYQTAYLKSNFPEAFMAALLTADQDNTDRVTIEIKECHKMGIDVLPPDVNESFSNFAVVENSDKTKMSKIRFGLNAIKNVGHNIAKVIIKERKANGKYKSVEDLLTRIKDKDLNKKSLESLVKAGALDSLISRGQALGNIVTLLEFNKKIQNEHKSGQNNLFADLPMASSTLSLKLDEFEDTAIETRLSWEKELMGLYISDHPFKSYIKILKKHVTTLDKIKSKEGQSVKVSGIVTNVHKIITHKGQAMLFVVIEDSTASTEIIVFPKTLDLTFQLWQDENKVIVEGKVSDKDGQAKILVERAELITEEYLNGLNARNLADDKLWLSLPQGFDKEKMNDLKAILDTSPGLSPVYLQINNGKVRKIKIDVKVLPDKQLKEKIIEFLGPDSWELKKD